VIGKHNAENRSDRPRLSQKEDNVRLFEFFNGNSFISLLFNLDRKYFISHRLLIEHDQTL